MGGIDVTVRGGGVFGLAVAWACARRGARVRLVETRRIGAGASGGVVGALAPHAPEQWTPAKQAQFESLAMAEAFWAAVAAAGGTDPGYARTGRLQPLADAAAVTRARERAAGAARFWAGAGAWAVVPAAGFAFAPASPTGLVVHDTLSARLHPRRACAALAAALRARGGEIVEGTGAPDAGAVVHATGWEGLAALSAALGRPVGEGVKGQALVLGHATPAAPQLSAGGLHVVPHADGTTAVGSTTERAFADPAATDAALDDLLARARAAVPALAGAPVLERWAGVRPRARSRAPLIGPWPGRPGHFVANGGFKTGFGLAPWAGERLADLVLGGRDVIPGDFRVEALL
jgi:glycine/D-amino acid oxidase-like deaminating enzyme